ncbi:MAG: hypothetical protein V2A77_08405 [Pseudomonadota bacterium]
MKWLKLSSVCWCHEARAWIARIEGVSRELGDLSRQNEGEILGLGNNLERFATAATRLSQHAAGVVESIRVSDQMSLAGEVFSSVSGRLEACNSEIVSGLARLESIGQRLDRLFRFQRSLNHLTRTVRMLRVATRMETVRLKDEGDDLSMLADEIDQFSQRMDGHVAGFFDKAAEVAQETARLGASLDAGRREYKKRLDSTEHATEAALTHIRTLLDQAARLSEITARRSREVVKDVGEIVASLQFHDITRQQIEHVRSALREVVDKLKERVRKSALRKPGDAKIVIVAANILKLQKSHLRQVQSEIEDCGGRIIESLGDISQNCEAQAHDLVPLVGRDTQKAGLNQLEEQMSVLAKILDQGSRLSREMFDSTLTASKLLENMRGGLVAVQNINEELNLLALNALVKVSRQAEGGRALAEIAEAINRLSSDPREAVRQAAEEVLGLLAEAKDLASLHEDALAENQKESEALAKAAAAALEGLRSLGREVTQTVNSLVGEAQGLTREIAAVSEGVRFHQIVAEKVNQAARILDDCFYAMMTVSGETRFDAGAPSPSLLEGRYTMESEREVHKAVLLKEAGVKRPVLTAVAFNERVAMKRAQRRVASAPAAGGAVAPGACAAEGPAGETAASGEELGDNVELF